MTTHKDKKRRVRARMAKTGESYQPAHRAVERAREHHAKPNAAPPTEAAISAADDRDFGDELPLIPSRNAVLFPGTNAPFDIGRVKSVAALETVVELPNDSPNAFIAVFAQRDPTTDDPGLEDLYSVGSAVRLLRAERRPSGDYSVVFKVVARIRLEAFIDREPFVRVRVARIENASQSDADTEQLMTTLRGLAKESIMLSPYTAEHRPQALQLVDSQTVPSTLADLVAANLGESTTLAEKVELLAMVDVNERLRSVSELLHRNVAVLKTEEGQLEIHARQRADIIRYRLTAERFAPAVAGEDPSFGDDLPAIALPNAVLMPAEAVPFEVDRGKSVAVAEKLREAPDAVVAVFFQRDPKTDDPGQSDLYPVGCAARVLKASELSPGRHRLWLRSLTPIRLEAVVQREPFLQVRISRVEAPAAPDADTERLATTLRNVATQVLALVPGSPAEAAGPLDSAQTPAALTPPNAAFR